MIAAPRLHAAGSQLLLETIMLKQQFRRKVVPLHAPEQP
jgi:hypothetical protein